MVDDLTRHLNCNYYLNFEKGTIHAKVIYWRENRTLTSEMVWFVVFSSSCRKAGSETWQGVGPTHRQSKSGVIN